MSNKGNEQGPLVQEGAYYIILSAHSGKAVTAGVNNTIYMGAATGAESQQWSFVPVGECYKLVNRWTGDVADVILAGVENGSQVHQWEDLGKENQLWSLEITSQGLYKIKSKLSGKCLDVVGISQEEGARLQIWEDLEGENQLWTLADNKAFLENLQASSQQAKEPAPQKTKRSPSKTKGKAAAKSAGQKNTAGKTVKKPAASKTTPKSGEKPGEKKATRRKAAPKRENPVEKPENK